VKPSRTSEYFVSAKRLFGFKNLWNKITLKTIRNMKANNNNNNNNNNNTDRQWHTGVTEHETNQRREMKEL